MLSFGRLDGSLYNQDTKQTWSPGFKQHRTETNLTILLLPSCIRYSLTHLSLLMVEVTFALTNIHFGKIQLKLGYSDTVANKSRNPKSISV